MVSYHTNGYPKSYFPWKSYIGSCSEIQESSMLSESSSHITFPVISIPTQHQHNNSNNKGGGAAVVVVAVA
jgi:hypothetical protein